MFPVVCISHTDGSGGDAVGRLVAEQLGYRYVNEDLILEAARLARVDPAVVAATEQKQTLLQKLLDALASAHESLGPAALAAGFAVPTVTPAEFRRSSKEDLRMMIRAAIQEVKKQGDAVIVAHAASMALAGQLGVLRIFVTAPDRIRSRRIGKERALPPSETDDLIAKGDAARAEYLKSFYDIDDECATHYDVVLSTEVLTPQQAATLVVAAARG